MCISELFYCFGPMETKPSSEDDRHFKAADSLSEAKTPPPQDDIFSDFFKNVQKIGDDAQKSIQEIGKNFEDFGQQVQKGITELFDRNTDLSSSNSVNSETSSDARQQHKADPSKHSHPALSPVKKSVTFSDGTTTTSKEGSLIILREQEKLVEKGIFIKINQQFPHFQTLKNLQSQLLDIKEDIQLLNTHRNTHRKQIIELNRKIEDIGNIQQYLALGGSVDKLQDSSICAQYINETSSRSLNPEEEKTLLKKISMIISKFNAGVREIAQIKNSSSILEKSIDSFRQAQDKITDPTRRFKYHDLDVPTLRKLAEIQSMSNLLKDYDKQSEFARKYLEKAFNYIVLVNKDNASINTDLKSIKTFFNISDSQPANIDLKSIQSKAETLREVFSRQTQTQERIGQLQSG